MLLVEDSQLVRRGIRDALAAAQHPRIEIVGEAGSLSEARAVCASCQPAVILLDLRLPDGNGLTACPQLVALAPAVQIIVLTSFANDSLHYEIAASGAQVCLLKDIEPLALIRTIQMAPVPDGGRRKPTLKNCEPAARDARPALPRLSLQQRRIMDRVAEGATNAEIAQQLGLSPNTIRNYLARAFVKLGASGRTAAVVAWLKYFPKAASFS